MRRRLPGRLRRAAAARLPGAAGDRLCRRHPHRLHVRAGRRHAHHHRVGGQGGGARRRPAAGPGPAARPDDVGARTHRPDDPPFPQQPRRVGPAGLRRRRRRHGPRRPALGADRHHQQRGVRRDLDDGPRPDPPGAAAAARWRAPRRRRPRGGLARDVDGAPDADLGHHRRGAARLVGRAQERLLPDARPRLARRLDRLRPLGRRRRLRRHRAHRPRCQPGAGHPAGRDGRSARLRGPRGRAAGGPRGRSVGVHDHERRRALGGRRAAAGRHGGRRPQRLGRQPDAPAGPARVPGRARATRR